MNTIMDKLHEGLESWKQSLELRTSVYNQTKNDLRTGERDIKEVLRIKRANLRDCERMLKQKKAALLKQKNWAQKQLREAREMVRKCKQRISQKPSTVRQYVKKNTDKVLNKMFGDQQ